MSSIVTSANPILPLRQERKLRESSPIIHIPRVRRFVCTKCGSRNVQVRPGEPARKPTGPFDGPSMFLD
jgi:hypothetical protein